MTIRKPILAALASGVATTALLTGCTAATSPAGAPAASSTAQAAETNPPGDIPDDQAFVVYTAADNSYSVKYPEGWSRTTIGSEVVFSDKFNSITLAPPDGFYQPSEDIARTVELPQLASATAGFTAGKVSTEQRPAGQVVLITFQGDSAPSPVTGKTITQDVSRYEFSRGGRGVVVTLAAPAGSDSVDPWRVVTDSFTWLR